MKLDAIALGPPCGRRAPLGRFCGHGHALRGGGGGSGSVVAKLGHEGGVESVVTNPPQIVIIIITPQRDGSDGGRR